MFVCVCGVCVFVCVAACVCMSVCVCVCAPRRSPLDDDARQEENGNECDDDFVSPSLLRVCACVCVCVVCVCVRRREKSDRDRRSDFVTRRNITEYECVCVCVCVTLPCRGRMSIRGWKRERGNRWSVTEGERGMVGIRSMQSALSSPSSFPL